MVRAAKSEWKRKLKKILSSVLLVRNHEDLCKCMEDVYVTLNSVISKCVEKKNVKRAKILRVHLQKFVILCNSTIGKFSEIEKINRQLSYEDLLAVLMSFFINVTIISQDISWEQKCSSISLHLFLTLGCSPLHIVDAVLGAVEFFTESSVYLLPLYKQVLTKACTKMTSILFLKCIILSKWLLKLIPQHRRIIKALVKKIPMESVSTVIIKKKFKKICPITYVKNMTVCKSLKLLRVLKSKEGRLLLEKLNADLNYSLNQLVARQNIFAKQDTKTLPILSNPASNLFFFDNKADEAMKKLYSDQKSKDSDEEICDNTEISEPPLDDLIASIDLSKPSSMQHEPLHSYNTANKKSEQMDINVVDHIGVVKTETMRKRKLECMSSGKNKKRNLAKKLKIQLRSIRAFAAQQQLAKDVTCFLPEKPTKDLSKSPAEKKKKKKKTQTKEVAVEGECKKTDLISVKNGEEAIISKNNDLLDREKQATVSNLNIKESPLRMELEQDVIMKSACAEILHPRRRNVICTSDDDNECLSLHEINKEAKPPKKLKAALKNSRVFAIPQSTEIKSTPATVHIDLPEKHTKKLWKSSSEQYMKASVSIKSKQKNLDLVKNKEQAITPRSNDSPSREQKAEISNTSFKCSPSKTDLEPNVLMGSTHVDGLCQTRRNCVHKSGDENNEVQNLTFASPHSTEIETAFSTIDGVLHDQLIKEFVESPFEKEDKKSTVNYRNFDVDKDEEHIIIPESIGSLNRGKQATASNVNLEESLLRTVLEPTVLKGSTCAEISCPRNKNSLVHTSDDESSECQSSHKNEEQSPAQKLQNSTTFAGQQVKEVESVDCILPENPTKELLNFRLSKKNEKIQDKNMQKTFTHFKNEEQMRMSKMNDSLNAQSEVKTDDGGFKLSDLRTEFSSSGTVESAQETHICFEAIKELAEDKEVEAAKKFQSISDREELHPNSNDNAEAAGSTKDLNIITKGDELDLEKLDARAVNSFKAVSLPVSSSSDEDVVRCPKALTSSKRLLSSTDESCSESELSADGPDEHREENTKSSYNLRNRKTVKAKSFQCNEVQMFFDEEAEEDDRFEIDAGSSENSFLCDSSSDECSNSSTENSAIEYRSGTSIPKSVMKDNADDKKSETYMHCDVEVKSVCDASLNLKQNKELNPCQADLSDFKNNDSNANLSRKPTKESILCLAKSQSESEEINHKEFKDTCETNNSFSEMVNSVPQFDEHKTKLVTTTPDLSSKKESVEVCAKNVSNVHSKSYSLSTPLKLTDIKLDPVVLLTDVSSLEKSPSKKEEAGMKVNSAVELSIVIDNNNMLNIKRSPKVPSKCLCEGVHDGNCSSCIPKRSPRLQKEKKLNSSQNRSHEQQNLSYSPCEVKQDVLNDSRILQETSTDPLWKSRLHPRKAKITKLRQHRPRTVAYSLNLRPTSNDETVSDRAKHITVRQNFNKPEQPKGYLLRPRIRK